MEDPCVSGKQAAPRWSTMHMATYGKGGQQGVECYWTLRSAFRGL